MMVNTFHLSFTHGAIMLRAQQRGGGKEEDRKLFKRAATQDVHGSRDCGTAQRGRAVGWPFSRSTDFHQSGPRTVEHTGPQYSSIRVVVFYLGLSTLTR